MKILGVIPARYASTRFPGKPLVNINGKSMIQRVYEQAKKCKSLAHVVVATDDDREPLFYSLVTAPAGMTIDALGRIRWQTQLDTPLGGHDVAVRVVDGLGGTAIQSFTFGVVADTSGMIGA